MRTNFDKEILIGKLKTNRDHHHAQYLKAFEGYRQEAIRVLETNLAALRKGEKRSVVYYESPPSDHTKDYDTAINLISMSSDSTIELDFKDFRQYVMDDWEWKAAWVASTSKYGVSD